MKCPCLYSESAPVCLADSDAMRVPPADDLNRYCLTKHYRRCEFFHRFLETILASPERWTSAHPEGEPSGTKAHKIGDDPGKEEPMLTVLKKLARDESGQDLAEYGIALAVIAVGVGALAVLISGNVNTLWTNASNAIAAAV